MDSYLEFEKIKSAIILDEMNKAFTDKGIGPLFKAESNARIVIVGQAPGRKAEESRLVWNDQSGDKLRKWMGVSREIFYETDLIAQLPMDFYYPGKAAGKTGSGDAPPRKGFAQKWHPVLLEKMPKVETIILVGSYAQKYYLADTREKNLTETVRNYEKYLPKFLPLVHPSPLNQRWMRKNPWFEADVVPVLAKIVDKALGGEDRGPSQKKPYFVYILRCQDNSLYTGITTDLQRRFKEHQGKVRGAKYTSSRKALHYEIAWEVPDRSNALKLEYEIKALSKTAKEDIITGKSAPPAKDIGMQLQSLKEVANLVKEELK